ncbi:phosphohydrolase [Porphyromonadaceae bacterium COT-184 OH4590]|nr:phosphohydrolase [Porphyromonadaceae bacterium COT-184 OH4590]MDO4725834.1 HDIG domain-containing protein [Porphyromonadaceae bacterium]
MNYLAIIDKYYQKDTPLYNIFLSHSISVKNKALNIARRHSLDVDLQFVEEASMLHDIGVFLTYAPLIHCFGSHRYIEHGYLGAEILRKEGYPKHALVCERHTGTGLSLEDILQRNLPLPHRDMMPVSLEEQLICYADLFFSKTRLESEATLDALQQKVALWGEKSLNTFKKWLNMFE